MKSSAIPRPIVCATLTLLLAACAGMPDLKNLPTNPAALKNMMNQPAAPGGQSMLETGMNVAKSSGNSMRDIPESEEIATGENIMAALLGAAPLYNNERIQRYVNQDGHCVAMQSQQPNLPGRVAVLDSPLVNGRA